ncbi:NAD-dependent epimerase/dehydratase family protein [Cronobacter sakazakii]|uniref:NAD-dependent epimerase/dehydratase family protein n=1 Tax=Cronobacter sakazakii TaxID=28141 RepID=UPI000DA13927|nr:SDR family oxidoreductase [Cronobacter sakazakii]
MSLYTVTGGRGFIGSHIVALLESQGHEVYVPARNDENLFSRNLGTVIYCAGNGDCQRTPFAVLEANTLLLSQILQKAQFNKLVYISSTRVYMNHATASEQDDVIVCNDDNRRLFNLTKLVAEEMCLKSGKPVTIVRPSNVYGLALNSPLFLPSIIRHAINNGEVNMYVQPTYAKDYVSVDDVAEVCVKLAQTDGVEGKVFNIAAGENTDAGQIADVLEKLTACNINWHKVQFPREVFPVTSIDALREIYPEYQPRNVLTDLVYMINKYKEELNKSA